MVNECKCRRNKSLRRPKVEDITEAWQAYKIDEKKAKPDYIDIDGDGDKEESMKKAAKDKKEKS